MKGQGCRRRRRDTYEGLGMVHETRRDRETLSRAAGGWRRLIKTRKRLKEAGGMMVDEEELWRRFGDAYASSEKLEEIEGL